MEFKQFFRVYLPSESTSFAAKPPVNILGPFHYDLLQIIPAWICIYMSSEVRDGIIDPFQNSNGSTVTIVYVISYHTL